MERDSPLWLIANGGDCNFSFSLSVTWFTFYFDRVLSQLHSERLVLG